MTENIESYVKYVPTQYDNMMWTWTCDWTEIFSTNDQAQSRPAVGVLQEQWDHLDGVHQYAIPEEKTQTRHAL